MVPIGFPSMVPIEFPCMAPIGFPNMVPIGFPVWILQGFLMLVFQILCLSKIPQEISIFQILICKCRWICREFNEFFPPKQCRRRKNRFYQSANFVRENSTSDKELKGSPILRKSSSKQSISNGTANKDILYGFFNFWI